MEDQQFAAGEVVDDSTSPGGAAPQDGRSAPAGAPQDGGGAPHPQDAGAAPAGDQPGAGSVAGAGVTPASGNGSGEGDAHAKALEADLEELSARAEKADEYLELAQRTRADFENFRKRAQRDAAAAQERGIVKLAKELLPAVDNLDRALASTAEDADDALSTGIRLVHSDVLAALARVGVEPFSPEGERFDPTLHEAVAQQPVDGAVPGTVVEVFQRGYRLGESVLRPARVLVAGQAG